LSEFWETDYFLYFLHVGDEEVEGVGGCLFGLGDFLEEGPYFVLKICVGDDFLIFDDLHEDVDDTWDEVFEFEELEEEGEDFPEEDFGLEVVEDTH
jgi:hypothetical protein